MRATLIWNDGWTEEVDFAWERRPPVVEVSVIKPMLNPFDHEALELPQVEETAAWRFAFDLAADGTYRQATGDELPVGALLARARAIHEGSLVKVMADPPYLPYIAEVWLGPELRDERAVLWLRGVTVPVDLRLVRPTGPRGCGCDWLSPDYGVCGPKPDMDPDCPGRCRKCGHLLQCHFHWHDNKLK